MSLGKTHEQSNKHKVKLIVDERHKKQTKIHIRFSEKQELYVKSQTLIFFCNLIESF
jgi:hypothetical protein